MERRRKRDGSAAGAERSTHAERHASQLERPQVGTRARQRHRNHRNHHHLTHNPNTPATEPRKPGWRRHLRAGPAAWREPTPGDGCENASPSGPATQNRRGHPAQKCAPHAHTPADQRGGSSLATRRQVSIHERLSREIDVALRRRAVITRAVTRQRRGRDRRRSRGRRSRHGAAVKERTTPWVLGSLGSL